MKRQILYIGNQLSVAGGNPTSLETLTPRFRELGFEVRTASAKSNQLLRLLEMLYLVWRFRNTASMVLIDTYSTRNFWYAYYVSRLSRRLKLRYVPLLHGGELPQRLQKSPASSQKLFGEAFINVAPSLYFRTLFQKAGFPKVRYIPNHIQINDYPFKGRRQLHPYLLWVRSFDEIYNPLMAIQVLEELLKKYPKASLHMVGSVKDESYARCLKYARSRRLPVHFKGQMSKAGWRALSEECDIFLNTTRIDNSPVSLIEAMALGLPVVSTNVGGIPYLISADLDGVLVPSEDVKKMVEAVEQFIRDPHKAYERSLKAREKVEAFDWELVKKHWLELLKS